MGGKPRKKRIIDPIQERRDAPRTHMLTLPVTKAQHTSIANMAEISCKSLNEWLFDAIAEAMRNGHVDVRQAVLFQEMRGRDIN